MGLLSDKVEKEWRWFSWNQRDENNVGNFDLSAALHTTSHVHTYCPHKVHGFRVLFMLDVMLHGSRHVHHVAGICTAPGVVACIFWRRHPWSGTFASSAWRHSLSPPRTFEDVYLVTQLAMMTTKTVWTVLPGAHAQFTECAQSNHVSEPEILPCTLPRVSMPAGGPGARPRSVCSRVSCVSSHRRGGAVDVIFRTSFLVAWE